MLGGGGGGHQPEGLKISPYHVSCLDESARIVDIVTRNNQAGQFDPICICACVQFLSVNPLDLTHKPRPSLQPRHAMSLSGDCHGKLSWYLGLQSQSEGLEKPGIESATPGLQVRWLNHCTTEASSD